MTDIEWTDETWNPIVGCSLASPGCTNCYAMRKAWRLAAMGENLAHYHGLTKKAAGGAIVWTGAMKTAPDSLFMKPFRWKKGKRVFVNSMGDLFHEAIPDTLIDRVFAVMALRPQHTFQVLTKRADRMREYFADLDARKAAIECAATIAGPAAATAIKVRLPLSNVWLGVSVEDQTRADERIPALLATPAALRFVSCEPLIGPLTLARYFRAPGASARGERDRAPAGAFERSENDSAEDLAGIDWVIAGGESGPGARPAHPDWFRALRDQCDGAAVPFFFKQWGSWAPAADHPDAAASAPRRIVLTAAAGGIGCGAGVAMLGIGKGAAGSMLDGAAHRAFPTPTPGTLQEQAA